MPEQLIPPELIARFDEAMRDVYQRAKVEAKYNATRFLEMLVNDGGLATAHKLLAADHVSDGFSALWEAGRQDLTVEAVVLQPEFRSLFSDTELRTARERLGLPVALAEERIVDTVSGPTSTGPADLTDGEPGDSQEQRAAEAVLLGQLGTRLQLRLAGHRFGDEDGLRAEVDGFSESPAVLVEVWAHIGVPKSAQKHKVLADALKLVWIDRRYLGGQSRKIILFADAAAVAHFQGRSWMAVALHDLAIELLLEELPADVRERVLAAQQRQYR